MKRVVITGLGALTPIGNDVTSFWDGLKNGKSGAAPITKFDTTHFKTKFACELKDFDIKAHLDRKTVKKADPFTLYGLVVSGQALQDSGLDLEKEDRTRIGVIWGTGNGGMTTYEEEVKNYANGNGTPRFNPFFIPKMLTNMASGVISMHYGLQGMNFTVISACATANTAIMDAFNYVRWGHLDAVVTGGSEAPITEASIGGFGAMKALSANNDHAAEACRPFDPARDGFVMGEGGGCLILEEYEHAKARGATIYAEIVGASMTADAYHLTATHPEGEGAQRAMRLALQDAQLDISEVDYLNVHATSTPVGDTSEAKAVAHVFGEAASNLHISATKSMTGHLLGAAGAVEAIASIKAIQEGIIPPTINTEVIDETVPKHLQIVTGQAIEKEVNIAMSNTFGFGGHNGIAVFKKFKG
ncbi:MAG: beta-ketoacyl-ACP synthase II [Flammeovirgaceae bacterium]